MKVSIRVSENFKKDAKPLLKKYPSLRHELALLGEDLLLNPTLGSPMGSQVYKIRLAIKSKGRGKSGGARVITYLEVSVVHGVQTEELTTINLISIYDKADLSTLTDPEIKQIIRNL